MLSFEIFPRVYVVSLKGRRPYRIIWALGPFSYCCCHGPKYYSRNICCVASLLSLRANASRVSLILSESFRKMPLHFQRPKTLINDFPILLSLTNHISKFALLKTETFVASLRSPHERSSTGDIAGPHLACLSSLASQNAAQLVSSRLVLALRASSLCEFPVCRYLFFLFRLPDFCLVCEPIRFEI